MCWIGLNALITVALDGATDSDDLADLLYIEFGKGFEYKTQFTIGMRNLGSQLSKQLVSCSEKAGECKCSISFVYRLNIYAYELELICSFGTEERLF